MNTPHTNSMSQLPAHILPSGVRPIVACVLLAAMVAGVIWIASSPQNIIPRTWPHQDKVEHLFGCAVLTLVTAAIVGPANWMRIAAVALGFAVGIEAVQLLPGVIDRTASIGDLIFNLLGVAAGLLFILALRLSMRQWTNQRLHAGHRT